MSHSKQLTKVLILLQLTNLFLFTVDLLSVSQASLGIKVFPFRYLMCYNPFRCILKLEVPFVGLLYLCARENLSSGARDGKS